TAEVLLRAGVSRDARTKVDRTPLHMAAADGHSHIVELLIRNGADVNAKDMLKMTALHWATEHNHRDVVALLLKYGADVHAFSKFDKSAFDIALDKNNPETLLMLQEAMQNQGATNPERANPVPGSMTVNQPFFLTSGEVLSLSSLVSSADTKTTSVVSEEVVETSAMERGAGGGAQRVITIVADGSSLGHLQAGLPGQGLGQPFIVTMQNGQQVLTLPAGQVAEEMVIMEQDENHHGLEEEEPPLKRIKVEHHGKGRSCSSSSRRPNQKAQEYRSRLMRKEQEAEKYRQRLEAMACPPDSGTETSAEDDSGITVTGTFGTTVEAFQVEADRLRKCKSRQ
uniref:Uncharacterized protein n=1 Tax=Anolis carolinensis TaxID=28377 RepID=H9G8G4_ANOCA